MKLRTIAVAISTVTAVLLSAIAAPAEAAATHSATITIVKSEGVPAFQIASRVSAIDVGSRQEFTPRAVSVADHADGHAYNVLIVNASVDYNDTGLRNVHLFASVKFGYIFYLMWIFESGTFTLRGDGGYKNWAFVGQFTRSGPDGKIVKFH